jgi:signal transduction histidine kinase
LIPQQQLIGKSRAKLAATKGKYMDGSPVRGQNKSSAAQISHAKNIQDFQTELIRLIRNDLPHTEVFAALRDRDSKTLHVPTWVRSHLEKHPGLGLKLEQGSMVGISHTDESPVPRPASAARSSVVLIPILHNDALCGAIGLISPPDGPQLSAEEIEVVRQLAYDAAPVLGRLQEIDSLLAKNQALTAAKERGTEVEVHFADVMAERNQFEALLKIGSHVQSNVAHELRTPLAAIRGYARMMLDGRTGEVSDTQRDYLKIINENTNRLIDVANWMTRLADLTAQDFSLGACDLRSIWAEGVSKNREMLTGKALNLTERIPQQSFEIIADGKKIAAAVNELLTAAAKLSESGSTITAEFSRGREQEVTVKISLSGSGIESEARNKALDHSINRSVAATMPDTDEVQKSLKVVRDIIGMHGGRMFVNSTPGQGSTLLFTLPAVTLDGEDKSNEQAVNISRR